ncbi:MAG TPA: NADPH-dependent FMN reductase, partial [Lactobacillus sp.]|nr:NADPH-dependent FMN reductase [Lactobacillus sp.]
HFSDTVDLEILDINDVPMFNQSDDQTNSEPVAYLSRKISQADGVIIATPEHNHTLTASLKSVIEWLSFNVHPFSDKPVMIVGASYYDQGSSRAQLMLRQILESPGVNAIVMPGNEFLLADVKQAFDENNNLKDAGTVKFLGSTLQKFVKFVKVINSLNEPQPTSAEDEDLTASSKIDTTIEGVDMGADDWVEQAAKKVDAVDGDTYVKLDRGILTVNQLDAFLNSMPIELTYADSNNQFIYYNHALPAKEMLAPRTPDQAGDPMSMVHPARAVKHVKEVIHMLRTGQTDEVKMPVPGNGPDKYVLHSYRAMRDSENKYLGINEYVEDLMPMIKWYLSKTGQKLVADPDAVSGASEKDSDASTGASSASDETPAATPQQPAAPETDASTGASEDDDQSAAATTATPTPAEVKPDTEPDDVTGASEDD